MRLWQTSMAKYNEQSNLHSVMSDTGNHQPISARLLQDALNVSHEASLDW